MFSRFAGLGSVVLCLTLGARAIPVSAQDCEPEWDQAIGNPGLAGAAYALTVFDDGGGPDLYVGGTFDPASPPNNYVARWNGSAWSSVGTGVNDFVFAMTATQEASAVGPAMYAGGAFQWPGRRIAEWSGTSWSALGTGANSDVNALEVFDGALYAGGAFTEVGGVLANRIAQWNGVGWSTVGDNGVNNAVRALAAAEGTSAIGPALYVGGNFLVAAGVPAPGIAKWDGANWSGVGGGMDFAVLALVVFNDGSGPAVYAGGTFTDAGGVAAERVAKWNGTSWSALGPGLNDVVETLVVYDDGSGPALYAGGWFTATGDDSVILNHVAKWDGANWLPLEDGNGEGTGWYVYSLAASDEDSGIGRALYVGGNFATAGGQTAYNIARWVGCAPPEQGDYDDDGDIDLDDFAVFADCMDGPDATPTPTLPDVSVQDCLNVFDFDDDNDVDLADFEDFQEVFTGSL